MFQTSRRTTKPVAAVAIALTLATGSIVGLASAAQASTTDVAATITVGSGPSGEIADGGSLYVANYNDGTVSVIEESTDAVTATITVGTEPRGLAAADGNVYVTNYGANTVSVIDEDTNTVTATIDVGGEPRAITAADGSLYVVNYSDGSVSVIDDSTGTVTATYPTAAVEPESIIADNGDLYISSFSTGSVDVVDQATGTEIRTVTVHGPIALAANDGEIYVTGDPSGLYEFAEAGTATTATAVVGVGGTPDGMTVANGLIYVADGGPGKVSVVGLNSLAADQLVTVGSEPAAAVSDQGFVYVSNFGSGTVSVLDSSPASPTDLATTAGNGKVELTWTAPTMDGGSPVTNYDVFAATKSGQETKSAAVCSTTDTSCFLSGLTNRTVYYYVIEAVNAIGASDPSPEVTAEPHANPTLRVVGLKATTQSDGSPVYELAKGATDTLTGDSIDSASIVLKHGQTQVATVKASATTGIFTFKRKFTTGGIYYVMEDNLKSNTIGIVVVPLTLKVSGSSRPGKHKLSGDAPAGSTVQLLQNGKVVAKTTASKHAKYSFSRKLTATHSFRIASQGVKSSTVKFKIS